MSLSLWSDICRIGAICGSALAVVGTIGHYVIGKVLDRQKNQRIEQLEQGNDALRKELEATAELAKPATLSLVAAAKNPSSEGISMVVFFKASKNEPFGRLVFGVTVVDASNARIVNVWPSLKAGAFQTGDQSFQRTDDGKAARLFYIPLGAELAAIEITVGKA